MSEKCVGDTTVFGLGFFRNRRKGSAVKNLAEALQTEAVRYKLSLGWEVKTEIPVECARLFDGRDSRSSSSSRRRVAVAKTLLTA